MPMLENRCPFSVEFLIFFACAANDRLPPSTSMIRHMLHRASESAKGWDRLFTALSTSGRKGPVTSRWATRVRNSANSAPDATETSDNCAANVRFRWGCFDFDAANLWLAPYDTPTTV